LAILGVNMSGFAIETAPQASVAPTPPTIEPLTIRRCGVGLRGYDPERAFPGFTLLSPLPTTNKTGFRGLGVRQSVLWPAAAARDQCYAACL
jgi:hypothetical protein